MVKPFDIFFWQPPGANWTEPHPAIVVSHPDRAARKDPVEVVIGSSQPPNRPPHPTEFILDEADHLDRPTLVKCDLIYAVPKAQLGPVRGRVCEARRGPLLRTILAAHGWAAWL